MKIRPIEGPRPALPHWLRYRIAICAYYDKRSCPVRGIEPNGPNGTDERMQTNLYLPTDKMFSRGLKRYSYLYVILKSCSGSDLIDIFSVYHYIYWLLGTTRCANIILTVSIKLLQKH